MRYLFAVDPSLTCSGWALFCLNQAKPLLTGKISAPPATFSIEQRIYKLQEDVKKIFVDLNLGQADFLVTEGPAPLVLNPSSALKVERVRGVFEAVARDFKLNVAGRLNPRTVQVELLGLKGKQIQRKEVKLIARQVAGSLFSSFLKETKVTQDEVDALLIGALASTKIQMAYKSKLPLEVVFASKSANRIARWR